MKRRWFICDLALLVILLMVPVGCAVPIARPTTGIKPERVLRLEGLDRLSTAQLLAAKSDSTQLAVGDSGGMITIIETDSWRIGRTINGGTGLVMALAYSPDGAHLVSICYPWGTEDAKARIDVKLWDTRTWEAKTLESVVEHYPVAGKLPSGGSYEMGLARESSSAAFSPDSSLLFWKRPRVSGVNFAGCRVDHPEERFSLALEEPHQGFAQVAAPPIPFVRESTLFVAAVGHQWRIQQAPQLKAIDAGSLIAQELDSRRQVAYWAETYLFGFYDAVLKQDALIHRIGLADRKCAIWRLPDGDAYIFRVCPDETVLVGLRTRQGVVMINPESATSELFLEFDGIDYVAVTNDWVYACNWREVAAWHRPGQ